MGKVLLLRTLLIFALWIYSIFVSFFSVTNIHWGGSWLIARYVNAVCFSSKEQNKHKVGEVVVLQSREEADLGFGNTHVECNSWYKMCFLMKVVPTAKYLIHEQMTVRNSVLAFHGPGAHCCCPAVNMKKFEIASSPVRAASHLPWN